MSKYFEFSPNDVIDLGEKSLKKEESTDKRVDNMDFQTIKNLTGYFFILIMVVLKCLPGESLKANAKSYNHKKITKGITENPLGLQKLISNNFAGDFKLNRSDIDLALMLFPHSELATILKLISRNRLNRPGIRIEDIRMARMRRENSGIKRLRELRKEETIARSQNGRDSFLKSIHYGLVGAVQIDFSKLSDDLLKKEFQFLFEKGFRNITFSPVMGQSNVKNTTDIELLNDFPGAPSLDDLKRIIPIAKYAGLSVTLKPYYIQLKKGEKKMRGYSDGIQPNNKWLENWKKELLKLADLAEKSGVSLFIIGNELSKLKVGGHYNKEINDIVSQLKASYSGKLAYAAYPHWYKQKMPDKNFWKNFDYVGYNVWPGGVVANKPVPTVSEWKRVFRLWFKKAARFGAILKKKIIFTEIGVKPIEFRRKCSQKKGRRICYYTDHTAYGVSGEVLRRNNSVDAQANAYRAILELLKRKEFVNQIKGAIFWQLAPGEILDKQIINSFGKYYKNGYAPRGKTWRIIEKKMHP